MTSSVVLTFHGIEWIDMPPNQASPTVNRYTISLYTFKYAINQIDSGKCSTVAELLSKKRDECETITFDDGLASDFAIAFPILKSYGLKATFFVSANNIDKCGYCTQDQIREMASAGMEIGSHGLNHEYLTTMSRQEAIREIRDSKLRIEDITGTEVVSFAPVGGHYSKWMVNFAQDVGYKVFASMIPGRSHVYGSIILLNRNHIQQQHSCDYITNILNGSRGLFLMNRIRYSLLSMPKNILGLKHYDTLKKYLGTVKK